AEPGADADRRARATRVGDLPHPGRHADPPERAPQPAGRTGWAPGDRAPLPPWRALNAGARGAARGGVLEGEKLAGWDRRLGREQRPGDAEILRRRRGGKRRNEGRVNAAPPFPRQSLFPLPVVPFYAEGGTRTPRARHEYHILETWEAGLVLTGSEIKSIREGKVSLKEAFGTVRRGEVWLEAMNVTPYESRGYVQHVSTRSRKLLLHRSEIR